MRALRTGLIERIGFEDAYFTIKVNGEKIKKVLPIKNEFFGDTVTCTGLLTATDILKGIDKEKPYKIIADRREAIAFAVDTAAPGDILLLAGKGHEEYEIKGRSRLPFSEREIVAACMAKKVEEQSL